MFNRFQLKDRIAIVTGGSRGIGFAIAQGFKDFGANVIIADIVDHRVQKKDDFYFIKCDIRNPKDITNLVDHVYKEFNRIDILVNNAAINIRKKVIEMDLNDWEELIRVNLTGTFLVSKEVGKIMIKQKKGSIINIGSNFGSVGVRGFSAYCVSKAGIIHLTRVLGVEWAKYAVRVNTISPAATRTERTKERLNDPKLKSHYKKIIPMGRCLETEDLIGAAIFFASDASSMITGHNLNVDGGYLAQGEF